MLLLCIIYYLFPRFILGDFNAAVLLCQLPVKLNNDTFFARHAMMIQIRQKTNKQKVLKGPHLPIV